MKRRYNKGILILTLVFLIGIVLPMGVACKPELPLEIENQTDMVLTIYVQDVNDGDLKPDKSMKI